MRNRCYNPNRPNFQNYGGRGIKVCAEWLASYQGFCKWARANGYKDGLELHRINGDGDYSPENCQWVTPEVNQNARSNNLKLAAWGETKTLAEWARDPRARAQAGTINFRIKCGWTPEKAISALPAGTE
jgi:hypothetical protein